MNMRAESTASSDAMQPLLYLTDGEGPLILLLRAAAGLYRGVMETGIRGLSRDGERRRDRAVERTGASR